MNWRLNFWPEVGPYEARKNPEYFAPLAIFDGTRMFSVYPIFPLNIASRDSSNASHKNFLPLYVLYFCSISEPSRNAVHFRRELFHQRLPCYTVHQVYSLQENIMCGLFFCKVPLPLKHVFLFSFSQALFQFCQSRPFWIET